jgi:hypothetical protein
MQTPMILYSLDELTKDKKKKGEADSATTTEKNKQNMR